MFVFIPVIGTYLLPASPFQPQGFMYLGDGDKALIQQHEISSGTNSNHALCWQGVEQSSLTP